MAQEKKVVRKTSIGGQALIEGVMMRGPERTAMAVRHTSGKIVTEDWETKGKERAAFWKLPLFRGMYNMVDSMYYGYKTLMRSAELAGLEDEEPEKDGDKKESGVLMNALLVFSTVLGVVIAVVLFMWLPSFLYKLGAGFVGLKTGAAAYGIWRGVFEGVLRIVLFLGYILIVSRMKDIRRVFMYHGAEHKTIFCYEHNLELTVENVRGQRRFHPRCGTSFLVLMLLIGIITSICIRVDTLWLRVVVKLLIMPLVVGVGYELIKLAGRKDNRLTRIISAPGLWMQRITTKEPDDSMIECAITAFNMVVPEDPEEAKW